MELRLPTDIVAEVLDGNHYSQYPIGSMMVPSIFLIYGPILGQNIFFRKDNIQKQPIVFMLMLKI